MTFKRLVKKYKWVPGFDGCVSCVFLEWLKPQPKSKDCLEEHHCTMDNERHEGGHWERKDG